MNLCKQLEYDFLKCFRLRGNENMVNTFQYNPLQSNALSPTQFEFAYPFQIEVFFLVPQVLIHCLYDAFIASKLCSTKVGFQF